MDQLPDLVKSALSAACKSVTYRQRIGQTSLDQATDLVRQVSFLENPGESEGDTYPAGVEGAGSKERHCCQGCQSELYLEAWSTEC